MLLPNPERNESLNQPKGIKSTTSKQHTQTDRKTRPLDTYPSHSDAEHTDKQGGYAREQFGKTKLVLNFLLTLGTLGAFSAAAMYAHYASEQIAPMIDAANAAKESADAAKAANQITISSNRPVIIVNAATIHTDGSNMLVLPYRNSARWTARFVGFHVHAIIGDVPPVGIPIVVNNSGEKCDPAPLDTTPLGEQDGYQLELQVMNGGIKPDIPATAAQFQDAVAGKRDLWAVGCIGYRDDFGNTYIAPVCEYYRAIDHTFMFCQITQLAAHK